MRLATMLSIFLLWPLGVTGGSTNETIAIEAENAPLSSMVDEVLKKRKINFVYSNSELGIGTNRTPKIDIRVTRRAGKPVEKAKSRHDSETASPPPLELVTKNKTNHKK